MLASIIANGRAFIKGNTAQFGGASGSVFSVLCGMQIPRFTSSKPSEFAFASDEKSIRRPTASFVRYYPKDEPSGNMNPLRAAAQIARRLFAW